MSRLKLLNVENQRRLFNILATLNLHRTKGQTQPQNELIQKINSYLESDIPDEKLWGIVGLLQHVKALLSHGSADECSPEVEEEIMVTLKRLADMTKGHHTARAEMYYELTEVLKTEKLARSKMLRNFAEFSEKTFKSKYFKDSISTQKVSMTQFEADRFVSKDIDIWFDIDAHVFQEGVKLNGEVLELIPHLLFLKQYALYKMRFSTEDVEKEPFEHLDFVLRANIGLTKALKNKNLGNEFPEDQIKRCNVFYFAAEWLRTVLNMFADYYRTDAEKAAEINEIMARKLDLLAEVEGQLNAPIRRLQTYILPNLTRHLPKDTVVKYKQNAEDKKVKKMIDKGRKNYQDRKSMERQRRSPSDLFEATEERDNSRMSIDSLERMNLEENADENEDPIREDNPFEERNHITEYYQLPVKLSKKQKPINYEKLRWYFTPLNLNTVVRLIQIIKTKRTLGPWLVENLYLLLKYAIPGPGRKIPIGFGVDLPLPQARLDYGPKDKIWDEITAVTPELMGFLNDCVNHFKRNPYINSNMMSIDTHKQMRDNFKTLVQIFARVFHSKDISNEIEWMEDSDTAMGDSLTKTSRRNEILQKLCHEISIFNASRQPLNATKGTSRGSDFNFIDDNSTETHQVGLGVDSVSPVIDYFVEIAKYAPTIEIGSAILDVLKVGHARVDIDGRDDRCAKVAIGYLAKEWTKDINIDKSHYDKECLKILNDYLDFRAENERTIAVLWLLMYSFEKVVPGDFLEKHHFDADKINIVDRENIVGQYKNSRFPSFHEKNIPAIHATLYRRLNNNVMVVLSKKNMAEKMDRPRYIIKAWDQATQAYLYLNIISRVEDLRKSSKRLLTTCIRESRRFTEFVISKNSSLMALFNRPKDEIQALASSLFVLIQRIQNSNRIVQSIVGFVKSKRWTSVLKLIPDLRATQEKFLGEIHKLTIKSGLGEFIKKIGMVKPKKIDGKDPNSQDETTIEEPKKRSRRSRESTSSEPGPTKKRGRKKVDDTDQPGPSKPPVKKGRKSNNAN